MEIVVGVVVVVGLYFWGPSILMSLGVGGANAVLKRQGKPPVGDYTPPNPYKRPPSR